MTIDELIRHVKTRYKGDYPHLYHVTDLSNWESISEKGLLSADQQEKRGIRPVHSVANDQSKRLDKVQNLTDYVCLTVHNQHAMIIKHARKRVPNPILIFIKPEVLYEEHIIYAPDVACANNTDRTPLEEEIKNIKYYPNKALSRAVAFDEGGDVVFPKKDDIVYTAQDVNYRLTHSKAEILVPQCVSSCMIDGKEDI